MNESLNGQKQRNQSAEQLARLREMERLRLQFKERRARRVQVIQDLHC